MSNYNSIEPTVIDEDLIRKAVDDQVNPEIAEIARLEGIDPPEVMALRLDYKSEQGMGRMCFSFLRNDYWKIGSTVD